LAAAAATFVEHGFKRAQMDDVAARLGVSKGTIYRHVDSKEALLAAVVTYADTPENLPASGTIESIDLGRLLADVRDEMAEAVTGLELFTAADQPVSDLAADVEHLARDLYETLARRRTAIMVLDRCAPELDPNWYDAGRHTLVDLWSTYLDRHSDQLAGGVDIDTLARTIVEVIALWAVKMPWDPAPRTYCADSAAVAAMVRNLVTGAPT
jgi:AcrR family transcriptional regulator